MTPEQIKRCAKGAPPPGEYSEALTFLAAAHLKLVEALRRIVAVPEVAHIAKHVASALLHDLGEGQ